MLLLAHVGITVALAGVVEYTFNKNNSGDRDLKFDYRLIVLGSMLPDIVDKPLGGLVLGLGNGRIYSHTMLFLLVLIGAGLFLQLKRGRSWGLFLAGGSAAHHLLDGMWLVPGTYLWPLYGWAFPRGNAGDWLERWLENLLTCPTVYVPEIVGGLIIIYFSSVLMIRVKVKEFMRTGRLGDLQ